MKRKLIVASSFLILLAILMSGVALTPVGADIIGSVKFDPDYIDLALTAPSIVSAEIRFPSGHGPTVKEINASTILLEGSLPPDNTYLIPGALVAEFDGEMVTYIIMGIVNGGGYAPPFKVWLTVTGKLNDASGGTPFSATGYIKVSVPHSPPPP